jgi:Domain of unknown function (DUF5658)
MSMNWTRRMKEIREERREAAERRARHVLFTDWRWSIEGRRQRGRRADDTAETGVDLYDRSLFVLALGIFVLSCMDATLTLSLIARGLAYEANPLMSVLMDSDPQLFINLKIVFTGAGLLFLVALADARVLRFLRVRNIMHALLIIYSAVVGYQLLHLTLTG